MNASYVFSSLTRISPIPNVSFEVIQIPRKKWKNGDYIVAEVTTRRNALRIELTNGRMMEAAKGDFVVGALGSRFATLEATGSWKNVDDTLEMHMLTGAGLLGRATSRSFLLPPLIGVKYVGHIKLYGHVANMKNFIHKEEKAHFTTPCILLVGTSMSAGKTTAAKILIRSLKQYNLKILGVKLTGAGRYRDILTMRDSGASAIYDFVDVGLPSTICPVPEFKVALHRLLSKMALEHADLAVVEIGASPMEPYNGKTAIETISDNIKTIILCASDPYGVLGVMKAFGLKPDLVSGIATNTEAGVQLIEKLSGVKALNIVDPETHKHMLDIIKKTFQGTQVFENENAKSN